MKLFRLILESWFDYVGENIKIFLGMFSFFMILSFSSYIHFLYSISYNINTFTLICKPEALSYEALLSHLPEQI